MQKEIEKKIEEMMIFFKENKKELLVEGSEDDLSLECSLDGQTVIFLKEGNGLKKTETFLLLDEENMPLLVVPKISKEEISYAAESLDDQEMIKFNKIAEQFSIDKENFIYEKSKVEKQRKLTNKNKRSLKP